MNSTGGNSGAKTAGGTTATGSGSYSVRVKPNPSQTFESVPETYAIIPSAWLDIGMALGKQPAAAASFKRAPLKYYDQLPNVAFDKESVTLLAGDAESSYDKENFYTANVDVHIIDPRLLKSYANWKDADIEEIAKNVGPFAGSTIRFAMDGTDPFYDLYGAFEKAAKIFQRQRQFREWQSFYDEFHSRITSKLPPKAERPSVAAIWRGINPDSGEFRISAVYKKQNNTRSFRTLGLKDAFGKQTPDAAVGYEELLDVDPDYIGGVGLLTSMNHDEFTSQVVEPLEANANGQSLNAVKNGNVVRTGGQYMGPIVDLFSTEALAKQVFPDQFGEWPGSIGDIPKNERLFDRKRLSEIINSNGNDST
ncbi:ferrichrome ABC transporter substrate-binding protein [Halococcus thailandensis JCM 13552]|uniref:Ferrichrome ABC transporter substrate-binding protein n=2 Tax=Halococcus thailandensis TaxID=335952 RepID=M0ND34_9EURY|nr:ABC transporter substrate-binding protein [Halococcus thailandensis]EMA55771.1 ferrichrome ABC transporter substrate-binding protein [Halococcus thailandensis JCM 13552]